MNHLKKFEEAFWKKAIKNINPFDKERELQSKFEKIFDEIKIPEISNIEKIKNPASLTYKFDYKINNSKIENISISVDKEVNESFIRIGINMYLKDHDVINKIRGYNSGYQVRVNDRRFNISFQKVDLRINPSSSIYWWESKELPVGEIFPAKRKYSSQDLDTIIDKIKEEVEEKKLNAILDAIDKLSIECDLRTEERTKKGQRSKSLEEKADEVSDYLIDLEDMSTLHNVSVGVGRITLSYNIKGIQVEKTEFSQTSNHDYQSISHTFDEAKLILTDKLLEIMGIIKTFKKRFNTDNLIVKIYFKTDLITIIINSQ